MSPSADAPLRKIERAKTHAKTLSREIGRRVDRRDFYGLSEDLDLESGECICRVKKLSDVPDEWSDDLGEIVGCLRSAIDRLACQLALLNDPECNLRGVAFPICLSREDFDSDRKGIGRNKIRRLAVEDQGKIDALQPYDSPEDPLWILSQLSNHEKHRLDIDLSTQPGLPVMGPTEFIDLEWGGRERFERPPYKEGSVVVTYLGLTKTGPSPKVNTDFRPTLTVRVDERIGREPRFVREVIDSMIEAIERVVGTFAARFP